MAAERPALAEEDGRPGARVTAGAAPLRRRSRLATRSLKPVVFALSCLPLANIGLSALRGKLTANPVAEVLNRLGFWTLVFLVTSLAISPMKILLGWTSPQRVRRMVGLFAFFYAALHFLTYLVVDQAFDWSDIGRDIVKRKFITVGFSAFLLLVPLALTSTNASVKRLGFRRWKRIHRLVYAAAVLGVIHFVWRVKADLLEPAIFGVVLIGLFAVRILDWARGRRTARAAPFLSEKTRNTPGPEAAR
jgi:sulfoxide reductase heme-binding subunit YedZ